ncbi:efflux RND transporter periplasmic adaptor subunit [bacterium]|nr:efflux RND transporter periplasmic adaptor subunit [bacterium]
MKKHFWLVAGVVFLALLVWRIVEMVRPGEGGGYGYGRPGVAVEVDSVHAGPIEDIRLFTGSIHPLYRYLVAPKVPGRVTRFDRRIGDYVDRNEVIARIDDAEYQQTVIEADANLKIARASLNEAKAQLELARKEFERAQSLRDQGLASSSDMDTAQSRFDAQQARVAVAEAQVQQREAALESARIRLQYTVLRASEPGYIGERLVDEGALLNVNSAVASVLGIDTVYVRSSIIERDYGKIQVGQQAEVSVDAWPGRTFAGTVSRIAPMLREESRVAEMEVIVPNTDLELKPGMFAKIHVVLEAKENALLVPRKAMVRRDGIDGIFLVAEGESPTAKWVAIVPGIQSAEVIEVLEPATLSGAVITLGQHLLDDGGAILLPQADSNGGSGETTR